MVATSMQLKDGASSAAPSWPKQQESWEADLQGAGVSDWEQQVNARPTTSQELAVQTNSNSLRHVAYSSDAASPTRQSEREVHQGLAHKAVADLSSNPQGASQVATFQVERTLASRVNVTNLETARTNALALSSNPANTQSSTIATATPTASPIAAQSSTSSPTPSLAPATATGAEEAARESRAKFKDRLDRSRELLDAAAEEHKDVEKTIADVGGDIKDARKAAKDLQSPAGSGDLDFVQMAAPIPGVVDHQRGPDQAQRNLNNALNSGRKNAGKAKDKLAELQAREDQARAAFLAQQKTNKLADEVRDGLVELANDAERKAAACRQEASQLRDSANRMRAQARDLRARADALEERAVIRERQGPAGRKEAAELRAEAAGCMRQADGLEKSARSHDVRADSVLKEEAALNGELQMRTAQITQLDSMSDEQLVTAKNSLHPWQSWTHPSVTPASMASSELQPSGSGSDTPVQQNDFSGFQPQARRGYEEQQPLENLAQTNTHRADPIAMVGSIKTRSAIAASATPALEGFKASKVIDGEIVQEQQARAAIAAVPDGAPSIGVLPGGDFYEQLPDGRTQWTRASVEEPPATVIIDEIGPNDSAYMSPSEVGALLQDKSDASGTYTTLTVPVKAPPVRHTQQADVVPRDHLVIDGSVVTPGPAVAAPAAPQAAPSAMAPA